MAMNDNTENSVMLNLDDYAMNLNILYNTNELKIKSMKDFKIDDELEAGGNSR